MLIFLCNVDYNTLAKVLARRLQTVITSLIRYELTNGIHGQSIQTNIHISHPVIECVHEGPGQVALLQIDLAKASERVNHSFVFAVLEADGDENPVYKNIFLCY